MSAMLTPADLRRAIEQEGGVQAVDVRSPGEFAAGHVPGAVNIPLEELDARLADLRPDVPVVWICQSGTRACMADQRMQNVVKNASVLEGGTEAWVASGAPVVRSQSASWALERQVRFGAGSLVLLGTVLGATVDSGWYGLAGFVGAGLVFASLTNICLMGSALAAMPWNKPRASAGS